MPSDRTPRYTMPVTFEEFRSSCIQHGYPDRLYDYGSYYVMYTRNNIKTELKARWYTVGYGRSNSDLDVLEEALKQAGFPIRNRKNSIINIDFREGENVMDRFWEIVELEETLDAIVARSRGTATRVFSREVADTAIWSKIARSYRFAVDEQHQYMLDDHRNILCADAVDHLITIGSSRARTLENSYREHVVPCVMIHNRAIEMTVGGSSTADVAAMLAANMMIVQISNEEARLLDETMGLRTRMPEGWEWGQDPLARLRVAGVELE